ncbi:MAG: hypothetical protein RIQ53_2000 [Pseudomonadota bacterium]|jgi:hypothetical protein
MKNEQSKYHAPDGRTLREWELLEHPLRNTDPEFDAEMEALERSRDARAQAAYRMDQARKQQRGW